MQGVLILEIFAWGVQLTRGRRLNAIADNDFVAKEEYNEPGQIGLGKRVGRTLSGGWIEEGIITVSLE